MPPGCHSLETTSAAISPKAAAAGGSTKLRLGEFPYADAARSLQQIHTAVRMLLGVLGDIEGHLGRSAVGGSGPAVASLLNSGRNQDDGSCGL
ncbi:hypothetical protein ColTof4_01152 [Colletotrichum tofieldiae]|nr:hypothetical protein ColTof3_08378 [Colletotrichum tofieldiae]GKT68729.1 hypothetical protein ColTof4_01152 [Colletotrichum tofieldiae]